MPYRNDSGMEPFSDADEDDDFATDEQFEQMQQLIADVVMLGLNEGQPTDSDETPPPIHWYRGLPDTERGYVEDLLRSAIATALAAVQGAMAGEDEDLETIELNAVEVLEAIRDYHPANPPYLDLEAKQVFLGNAQDEMVIFDDDGRAVQIRLPEIDADSAADWMREFLESESRSARKAGLRALDKTNGLTRCVEELAKNHPESYESWLEYQVDRILEEVAGLLEQVGFWPDFGSDEHEENA